MFLSLVKTTREVIYSMSVHVSTKPRSFRYGQLLAACVAKSLKHGCQRVCYHLKAPSYLWTLAGCAFEHTFYVACSVIKTQKKDALAVFWDSTRLFWETTLKTLHLFRPYLDTQITSSVVEGVARYTVHKHQPGQTITNPCVYLRNKTTVTVNHSLLKGWRRLGLLRGASGGTSLMKP